MSVVLSGLKVPVPPLQIPPVAPVTDPLKDTCALFAQSETAAPAFTTGAAVKAIVI